jgi:hypothetical protein
MKRRFTKADFKVPALLVVLSLVPTLGGVMRLTNLSGPAAATAEHARFAAAPAPILIHVLSATLYCLLGAFQFSSAVRGRFPTWHRGAGRLLVLCGLLAGASGLWMTVLYPIAADMQGSLLYVVRLAVGSAMVASIVVALSSILRRNVTRHEAFMIRAYALGQGAGTQVLVLLPWMLVSGERGGLTRDLLMTLAWTINVVVAESIISFRKRVSPNHVEPAAIIAQ